MKFWDSSAIVPLLINEASTPALTGLARSDAERVVWWGTAIECVSALARRLRLQEIDQAAFVLATTRLTNARRLWSEIPPSPQLRSDAERLLIKYPLTAADAIQLAAALRAADGAIALLAFVCLDERLSGAARGEGFTVEP
ncbi:MAG TPA: type II toxin-antitoxin system VapC family toxin [Rhizomicrobium sp.]|nr:type II toxin-antitoxin system VapC family toxin [Rhizomicrobium sp.]